MELFGGAFMLVCLLSFSELSESISTGTISWLFSFSEFDSLITSPIFLVEWLTSNFLVIGDNDSANLTSCACFRILFLI